MNLEIQSKTTPRKMFFRVLISTAWFFAIYEGACILIGGIVGGLAGAATHDYATGHEAGQAASAAFFEKYWLLVFIGAVGCTGVLSWRGILPGTGSRTGGLLWQLPDRLPVRFRRGIAVRIRSATRAREALDYALELES